MVELEGTQMTNISSVMKQEEEKEPVAIEVITLSDDADPALVEVQPRLIELSTEARTTRSKRHDIGSADGTWTDVDDAMDRIGNSVTCNFKHIKNLDNSQISDICMPGHAGIWLSKKNHANHTLYVLTREQTESQEAAAQALGIARDSSLPGTQKGKYDQICAMTCNSAFIFVATVETNEENKCEFNIRTFCSRTHKEHEEEIIRGVYTSPILKMIATEDILITLGDDEDPVVRFWNIDSKDFNQVFTPDQKLGDKRIQSAPLSDVTDISYWNGLLAISVNGEQPQLQIWGAKSLIKNLNCTDEAFRDVMFSHYGDALVQIPKSVWVTTANHIQFYDGRIVFLDEDNRLNYIEVDIYNQEQAKIQECGARSYSRIARICNLLVAQEVSIYDELILKVWDFEGDFLEESIVVQKALTNPEHQENIPEKHQLYVGVKNVIVSFDGATYHRFKTQNPDGETSIIKGQRDKSLPFIFAGNDGEMVINRQQNTIDAQDVRSGSKYLLKTTQKTGRRREFDEPLHAGEKMVVPKMEYDPSRQNSIIHRGIGKFAQQTLEADAAETPPKEVKVCVFESSGHEQGTYTLAEEGNFSPCRWRIVCNRTSIALLDLPDDQDKIYVTFFRLRDGKPIGPRVPIPDIGIDHEEIVGFRTLNKLKKKCEVILDDNFQLFFIGATVYGYDFLHGTQMQYENRGIEKGGNVGIVKAKKPWKAIDTDSHLICWNYVASSFKSINSYIINVFNKQTNKLVKVFEFESKNNEKEFYVSAAPCEDRQNFVVMVSKYVVDRITNVKTPDTQLYFASTLTLDKQPLAKIDGLQRAIYTGNDCFVLVSDPYLKDHKKVMTIKRWSISANLKPIAFQVELQKMYAEGKILPYRSELKDCILFPEMINYTQIYAYMESHHQLAAALRDECPLLVSSQRTSALSIAVSMGERVLSSEVIKTIADNPKKGYERQLEGSVMIKKTNPKKEDEHLLEESSIIYELMGMTIPGLEKVLENSIIPYHSNVPEYLEMKEDEQTVVSPEQIINHREFNPKKKRGKKQEEEKVEEEKVEEVKENPEGDQHAADEHEPEGEEDHEQGNEVKENLDAVQFWISSFQIDAKYGSKESTRLIELLLEDDNQQLLSTRIVKIFTDKMWKQAKWDILFLEIYFMVFAAALTFEIFYFDNNTIFEIVLLALLVPLIVQEVREMISMKWNYFDFWNAIDFLRVFVCYLTMISIMADPGWDEEVFKCLKALSLLLSWLRSVSIFRLFESTRYLIRIMVEIWKGMIPFTVIFVFCTFFTGLAFQSMRGQEWYVAFTFAWRLAFNDFEDVENYASWGEIIIFLFSTVVLPLLLLNVLIAIMGDVYARVQENEEIADTRETLTLIQEISRYCCRKGTNKGYLHICTKQEFFDSGGPDAGGAVGVVKTACLDKLSAIDQQMKQRMEAIQQEFDDLEVRMDARYRHRDANIEKEDRLNKSRWARMGKRINRIEIKMNDILTRSGIEVN